MGPGARHVDTEDNWTVHVRGRCLLPIDGGKWCFARVQPFSIALQTTQTRQDMIDLHFPSRHNHYVPEWYQNGFSAKGEFNFFLDLSPPYRRRDGTVVASVPRRRPPKSCFWELDLYVTRFASSSTTRSRPCFSPASTILALRQFAPSSAGTMHECISTMKSSSHI
jgi:hypothetical protein